MKLFLVLSIVSILFISADGCKKNEAGLFKGRLEIKQLCMNYTIKVIDGSMDTSLISSQWEDEFTKKKYTDVFALGSKCNFPDSLKEGDEFYFRLDTSSGKDCVVCLAYYPTPPKKLNIRVVQKP